MQDRSSAPKLGSCSVLLWALASAGCPSEGADEPARDTDAPTGGHGEYVGGRHDRHDRGARHDW